MIKLRMYTQEEFKVAMTLFSDPKADEGEWKDRPASARDFEDLLTWASDEGEGKPPFRDKESVSLLKSQGLSFVSEKDWYCVEVKEFDIHTRMPITSISKELKYALTAMHFSREGTYTWLNEEDHVYEEVWQYLSELPFDILVALRIEDRGCFRFWGNYKIANCPFENQTVEATVVKRPQTHDFAEDKQISKYLYADKTGRYYTHWGVEDLFAYDWKKDIEGIIRHIESFCEDAYWPFGHATLPKEVLFRKVPCLIVDKHTDGTYVIGEALSVKYPSFGEILSGVIPEYSPNKERCVLVVECNERLEKQEDIDNAIYGIRILQDQIELFEKDKAVQVFGMSLKEACASGQYTVVEGNCYR